MPTKTPRPGDTQELTSAAGRAEPGWRELRAASLRIIEARPLAGFDWLIHGFSTRCGGVSELNSSRQARAKKEKVLNLGFTEWDAPERVVANRKKFLRALAATEMRLVTLAQAHSDIIHRVEEPPQEALAGDALIARERGLLLAVQTADCIPILLVDPERRAVAAIHAGWRGALKRIAGKAVGRMQMEFAARPEDLFAALGPGIRSCCYEVGPEVAGEFAGQFPQAREWFDGPFDALSSGKSPNPIPWLASMPPGHPSPPPRVRLDLHAANRAILIQAGLRPERIFSSGLCTACRTDLLFSYRREVTTGRLMAVIGLP